MNKIKVDCEAFPVSKLFIRDQRDKPVYLQKGMILPAGESILVHNNDYGYFSFPFAVEVNVVAGYANFYTDVTPDLSDERIANRSGGFGGVNARTMQLLDIVRELHVRIKLLEAKLK